MDALSNLTFNINGKEITLVAFSFVWVAAVLGVFYWLFSTRTVEFDEQQTIYNQFQKPQQYADALSTLESLRTLDSPTLVRVIEPGCRCNSISEQHWSELKASYDNTQFLELQLNNLSEQEQALIPSTPMAIYVNSFNSVLYAGPFSEGRTCNSGNSLVTDYVAKKINMLYFAFDIKGCYCAT
jgi:hypothetical protein